MSESLELTSLPAGGLAVVIGATGGIGRAVADALAASGRFAAVLRLSRSSQPRLDLTDEASIEEAAEHIAAHELELRLVFDATGFLHDADYGPEKQLAHIQADHMARAFALNATGPALLMKHLLPRLPRQGKAVFATLSAKVGSIGDNRHGGWYAYRASKAALNQLVRSAAIEVARKRPEAVCLALHPGTVATQLTQPFSKQGLTVRSPETAAGDLLGVIDRLDSAASGGFYSYTGDALPW